MEIWRCLPSVAIEIIKILEMACNLSRALASTTSVARGEMSINESAGDDLALVVERIGGVIDEISHAL